MMCSMLIFGGLLLAVTLTSAQDPQLTTCFPETPGKLLFGGPRQELTGETVQSCKQKCIAATAFKCIAINFFMSTGDCLLYDFNSTINPDQVLDNTDPNSHLFERTTPCGGSSTVGPGQQGCVDIDDLCPFWASVGQCDTNPYYMYSHCCLSCAMTGKMKTVAAQPYGGYGGGGMKKPMMNNNDNKYGGR